MARTPMRTFLRGCLRALNYLLAIVGVLMVAYALFMYVEFTEGHPSVPPENHMILSSGKVAERHQIFQIPSNMQAELDFEQDHRANVNGLNANRLTK